MCGRFTPFLPAEALGQIFGTVDPPLVLAPQQPQDRRSLTLLRHPPTPADFDSISLLRSSGNVQLLRSALLHRSSLLRMPSAYGVSHSTVERGT